MKLGQRMVRLDDGMRGVVALNGPDLRVVYVDRGEERVAPKTEKWAPDEIKPGPLLQAEIHVIALYADRALRAYERNEPHRFWETPKMSDEPYDSGLVRVIADYLGSRETRTAG
jgi:hypothetical protein